MESKLESGKNKLKKMQEGFWMDFSGVECGEVRKKECKHNSGPKCKYIININHIFTLNYIYELNSAFAAAEHKKILKFKKAALGCTYSWLNWCNFALET